MSFLPLVNYAIGLFSLLAVFSTTQCTLGMALVYSRVVVNPIITAPTQGEPFNKGEVMRVAWEIPSEPAPKGEILLGFIDPLDPDSGENLDIDHPLATNVDFTTGHFDVKLDLDSIDKTRNTYIVVVLGDSGNASPHFTINV